MAWRRVTKEKKCEICGKPDWCTKSEESGAACCMRVKSDRPLHNGGYLHGKGTQPVVDETPRKEPTWPDFSTQALAYANQTTDTKLDQLAQQLALTTQALRSFNVGWSIKHQAWTFPMIGPTGICGLRLRKPDGSKTSVTGSKQGVFVPNQLQNYGSLWICEGPTDAIALTTIGLPAIGRPSCRGGHELVQPYAAGRRVIIMADADATGQDGANQLKNWLICNKPKPLAVKMVTPRATIEGTPKDARAMVAAGASRNIFISMAANAKETRPALKARAINYTRKIPATPIPPHGGDNG